LKCFKRLWGGNIGKYQIVSFEGENMIREPGEENRNSKKMRERRRKWEN
jgi:hypothetical protein